MVHSFTRRLAPAALLALGATVSGCGYVGDWGEVRGVPLADLDTSGTPPTKLELAGPDRLLVTEGGDLAITVEGDSQAAEALKFDRQGDRLTIARDQKIFDGRGEAIVRVTMPSASTLGIAGSGTIEADTVASDAELEIAGSGDINVGTITADRLEVEIAGSGEVTASGSAAVLSVEIAGSGDVKFANLSADTVTVEIAGSGDVELASNGTVDVEIAGSGDVIVTGSATCSVDAAGSGSLTCKPAATALAEAGASGADTAAE
ncbi:MAG: head GIN domain-containing protein [Pseudomonadota bacterium]